MRDHLGSGQMPAGEVHEDEQDAVNFSSLVQILWDNRWLLVVTTGLGLLSAAWYLHNETPIYTSTAQVVLETDTARVVNVESVVPDLQANMYTLNTQSRVLRSHQLMLRTVDALSLEQDPEFNPALREPPEWKVAIGYDALRKAVGLPSESRPPPPTPEDARNIAARILRSKISVSNVDYSLIFNIETQTQGPKKSAEIANTITEFYVAAQREKKFDAMDAAMEWLGDRVGELKVELEEAESAVEDFGAEATLVSRDTLAANTQRLKVMRARHAGLADAASEMARRAERLATLRAERDFAALAQLVDEPRIEAAAADLASGQAAEGSSVALTPSDPALRRFDAMFERWLDGLRADAVRAEDQVAAASRSVAELERQVDAQSEDLVTLRQLQREAESTRLIYESFLGRLKEISVQQGIQQADSRIMSQASYGVRSHPSVSQVLPRGGIFGFVLGLVIIVVRHLLRTAVRTPEELEAATGITVIGVIPEDRIQQPDRLIGHIVAKPASRAAAAVRNLRTAIQLSNIDVTPQVILVTSSVPDEGKSVLAATLAETSALAGKRVLLVDSDLRRRILREYFHMDTDAGLVSLLSKRTSFPETIQTDERTGLDLILADDHKVTPDDIFDSETFANFIADARKQYDLIVLDSPPVLAVPDTRIIAQRADAVVYCVRWNSTSRRMVQTGLDLLGHVNVRINGLVLTRVDPRGMDRYGYYGYGYGAGSKKLQRYYSG